MRERYDIILTLVMLLMTGCSAEDAVMETMTAPEEGGVAISFSCNYDDIEAHTTKAGLPGAMNTEDLRTTGFGAMASVTADKKPTLMYNQEVEYTLVGDLEPSDPEDPESNPIRGYWGYSPTKYWPNNLEHCYISAYAPYVEASDLTGLLADESETGIVGISENDEAPYIDYRRCETPASIVDLLWYYEEPTAIPAKTSLNEAGTLAMQMRHALARLEIKVALAADPGTTKVLIEEISLTGKMAKTGRLSLCSQTTVGSGVDTKYYPIWTNQVYDKDLEDHDIDHTIKVKNADNAPGSYGIIDSPIRYIPELPHGWQPAGLKYCDSGGEGKGYQNALNTGDRKGYIYLIPQETLSLKIGVKYHVVTEAGVDTPGEKSIDASPDPTPITISPFYGNKTYAMKIKLTI